MPRLSTRTRPGTAGSLLSNRPLLPNRMLLEAIRRPRGIGGQRVVHRLRHIADVVDDRLPGVRQYDARVLIERVNAALEQVAAVQVIGGRPLEVLSARLLHHEVVVRRKADIPGLADVANPGILLPVTAADVRGAVGRGVIRDDQLEILIALPQQGLDRLGEILLAVIDGKPDAQPGGRAHSPATRGRTARRECTGTAPLM